MRMEPSLNYAIAKAKRNLKNFKYGKIECVLDAMYEYDIRANEVETMVKSINKWLVKNDELYGKPYTEDDIKYLIREV